MLEISGRAEYDPALSKVGVSKLADEEGASSGASGRVTLGQYLSAIRSDRNLSLRQVEEATGKEVSNAYLSQLENDKVKQPSPNILHALSSLYAVDYVGLMERAGYLNSQEVIAVEKRHGRAATFADIDLSSEEETELLRFLKFIRSEKK